MIQEGNKITNNIYYTIDQTAKKFDSIKDNNSEILAYNSRITAQNTFYLAWINGFRLIG